MRRATIDLVYVAMRRRPALARSWWPIVVLAVLDSVLALAVGWVYSAG